MKSEIVQNKRYPAFSGIPMLTPSR